MTVTERPDGLDEWSLTWLDPTVDVAEHELDSLQERIIERLPSLSDEGLLRAREASVTLGRVAWRIECACDAEEVGRAIERGHKTEEIKDYAKQLNVGTTTVYRNADIHRVFFPRTGKNDLEDILPDKMYWRAALDAPNPIAAIEMFAEIKGAGTHFLPADAERLVKDMRRDDNRLQAGLKSAEYVGEDVRVIVSDAMDFIAGLPDGSVDLLLTDPPYNVTENDWDIWDTDDAFAKDMGMWFAALLPKMAAGYTAFIFCDADYSPELYRILKGTGWDVLHQVIWHRPNLAKKRSGSLTFLSAYEPFWHCGNQPLVLPEEWADERFDVQRFAVPQSNHTIDPSMHPTQKPLALFERLVTIGSKPGDLVIDPFCGAGTTPVAALKGNRRCLAGDQSEEHVKTALGR
nr:site-specific DNA-methyltransferase [Chloroflexota bacterium]